MRSGIQNNNNKAIQDAYAGYMYCIHMQAYTYTHMHAHAHIHSKQQQTINHKEH